MTTPPFNPQPCCGGGEVVTPLAANFAYETLCDADPATGVVYNVVTQQTEYDDQGNPVGMVYFDATTGEPYTPVGEVTSCSLTGAMQIEVLCEFTEDGQTIPFIRRYTELENGAILVQDASLGGDQSYDVAPTSTVGICPQTITPPALPGTLTEAVGCEGATQAVAYSDTVRTVTDQTVTTVGCNDANRDTLLTDIKTAVQATASAGGSCAIPLAEVCLSNGHHGTVVREPDGTLSRIDTTTGASFTAGDVVPCPPDVVAAGQSYAATTVTDASGNAVFTFPTPFPSAPVVSASIQTAVTDATEARITALSATGCTVNARRSPGVTVVGISVLSFPQPLTGATIHLHAVQPGTS
jgi:hypothetical protein